MSPDSSDCLGSVRDTPEHMESALFVAGSSACTRVLPPVCAAAAALVPF